MSDVIKAKCCECEKELEVTDMKCDECNAKESKDSSTEGLIKFLREMPEDLMIEAVQAFYYSTTLSQGVSFEKFAKEQPQKLPFFTGGVAHVFNWLRLKFKIVEPVEKKEEDNNVDAIQARS